MWGGVCISCTQYNVLSYFLNGIYYIYFSFFRTPQVPKAGKCDESMYKAGTMCNSDSDEKSPPSNTFKHSGMI